MDGERLADDEVVYRRIPAFKPWFEPPDRIATGNFKLDRQRGDLGLSVYRASVVSADELVAKPDALPNSLVASALVGDIRALRSGDDKPLQLDVIAVNDENDPGHAEIRGPTPGTLSPAASNALRNLFQQSLQPPTPSAEVP
ncbi:MAG: hypothetical protein HYS13_05135 [Planctomycetia bacterium]|nr:hypothetical protein [Planctomycetia bacterium]